MEEVNLLKCVCYIVIKCNIGFGNDILFNRIDFIKLEIFDIFDVYSVVRKDYLLCIGFLKDLVIENGVQMRENVGWVRIGMNIDQEGKEMDKLEEDCKLLDILKKLNQKLDLGQGFDIFCDIQILSILFEIYFEYVIKILFRLKSLERKGN